MTTLFKTKKKPDPTAAVDAAPLEALEQRADALALMVASGNDAARAELQEVEQELGLRRLEDERRERAARAQTRDAAAAAEARLSADRQRLYDTLTTTHEELVEAAREIERHIEPLREACRVYHERRRRKSAAANALRVPDTAVGEERRLTFYLSEALGFGNRLPAYRELRLTFCDRLEDGTFAPPRLVVPALSLVEGISS